MLFSFYILHLNRLPLYFLDLKASKYSLCVFSSRGENSLFIFACEWWKLLKQLWNPEVLWIMQYYFPPFLIYRKKNMSLGTDINSWILIMMGRKSKSRHSFILFHNQFQVGLSVFFFFSYFVPFNFQFPVLLLFKPWIPFHVCPYPYATDLFLSKYKA